MADADSSNATSGKPDSADKTAPKVKPGSEKAVSKTEAPTKAPEPPKPPAATSKDVAKTKEDAGSTNRALVKKPEKSTAISKPEKEKVQPVGSKVSQARAKSRHWLLMISFAVMVVLPTIAGFVYLYGFAAERFASSSAFSVHKEDSASPAEMLTGLNALGIATGSTPDADILYQYILSQGLVQLVDEKLDLRERLGTHYGMDPIFSLDPDASLEDLVDYWQRVVSLEFQPDIGLISMEVSAFTPEDAQLINQEILDASSDLINRLSKIARDDSIRLAQEELDKAAARVKDTRVQMSKFRDIEQIIDPTADLAGQMGVIAALQQSLAQAMIRRDLLVGTTRDGDPRIIQADREILAIQKRIQDERTNVGARNTEDSDALARVVGEYESLLVDREFAEQSYVAALAAYDLALADARRKSRYLAVHINPTLAQTAIYPQRLIIGSVFAVFLFMIWALFALTLYSIRDRR